MSTYSSVCHQLVVSGEWVGVCHQLVVSGEWVGTQEEAALMEPLQQ